MEEIDIKQIEPEEIEIEELEPEEMKVEEVYVKEIKTVTIEKTVKEKGLKGDKGDNGKDGKDGKDAKPTTKTELKTLIKEVFPEDKLLEKLVKKLPKQEVQSINIGEDRGGKYLEKNGKKMYLTSGIGPVMSTGVHDFLHLTDAPSSYVGQGGKVVKVKADETGLEFGTGGGGGGSVDSVVAGTGINVDNTDPANPVVSSTITQYTDEMAQDAVGNSVGNGLDYDDGTGAISVDESELTHNSLGGLQGGTTGQYNHLTNAQLTVVQNTSGTNTGDQTSVTGNAGTATALQTARTIGTATGDVTSAGSSFDGTANNTNAYTIANSAVTLAKMADLAQDQFIGRTTASTGVPQTATITAAARTVLDDTTVAAMVDTLGGASSTGTGGIVRATSPTLVTPALGTPSALVGTNITGTGAGFTAGDSTKIGGITVTGTPSVGQVPIASSSSAAAWGTPTGGGMTQLADVTLGTAAASLSSGTITAKKFLQIYIYIPSLSGSSDFGFRFNSDTGNHYNYMSWDQVNNSGVSRANQSKLSFTESNGNAEFYGFFDINNYASGVNKGLQGGLSVNGSNEYQIVGRWNDTSAQITTVLLYNHSGNTFGIGTRMVIYGMD